MPVYLTTLTAPNGNRVSRPIVATDAPEAIGIMSAEHGIDADAPGVTVDAQPIADPAHEMEASLLRMERRNQEREWLERR